MEEMTRIYVPQRAEVLTITSLVIMLFIYLVVGVLSLIFGTCQPLKARGISPYLTIFFLFAQLAMEIRSYDYPTDYQASLCVYLAFGYYPLTQIVFTMILLYFIRYFSIINFNQNKNSYLQPLSMGR